MVPVSVCTFSLAIFVLIHAGTSVAHAPDQNSSALDEESNPEAVNSNAAAVQPSTAAATDGHASGLTEVAGRQGSEGQMMLLPAGIRMNDLLALAEEMDPLGSPGKEGKPGRRGLTADSTMQLASYLATKVTFVARNSHPLLKPSQSLVLKSH